MTVLDSRVALALMAKAERVFGQAGQMLAFQIGGSAFSAKQLNFFPKELDAERIRQAKASLADFSAFANSIPDSQVWLASGGRADLPSVYREVLKSSEIASLTESPGDLEKLATVRAVLFTRGSDGVEVDTSTYISYKECRDAYILASQQYNAARTSGELSTDPADTAAWQQNELVMRSVRDQALAEWETRGQRAVVDDAFANIATLTPKAPATTWNDWELRSREGIGTETSLSNMPFWPTYISPANACDVGWQQMTLSRGEVMSLQQSAPADIRQRIGEGQPPLEIERLEFEYTSAKLHRPWFDPAVFASRFWRPLNGDLKVSSGGSPFTGICPLYASGVVFVRHIRAYLKEDAEKASTAVNGLGDRLDMGLFQFRKANLHLLDTKPADQPASVQLSRVRGILGGSLRQKASSRYTSEAAMRERPRVANLPASTHAGFDVRGLLEKRAVMREANVINYVSPPAIPVRTSPVLETSDDDIYVLAMICSIVPASPNPDPTLSWS